MRSRFVVLLASVVSTFSLIGLPVAPAVAQADPCAGWTTRVVAEGLGTLENLEPDGTGGMLISATTRNAVERLAPDGTVESTVAADMPAPGGLRVRDGILFANTGDSVADGLAGNTNGTIERIDLTTGDRTTYTSGLTMPNGLVFDGDGNAYTSRDVGMPSSISKVPVDDPRNPDTMWADLPDTNGMVIDPTGELLYVVTTFNAPASVFSVALDDPTDITEIAQLMSAGGPNPAKGLDDLTIDADGILYITANGSGELIRLDPLTGETCLITGALQNPSAVKFGAGPGWPSENLYVSAFDGRVVEVVPPTPTATPTDDRVVVAAGPVPVDFGCPARSWIAGTTELCGGVLTHHDYVYDDYGADLGTTASSTGTLAVPAGDVRYPEPGPHNTADLVDLSMRVVGDRLELLAEVNALYTGDSTVVAVALDTDDNRASGGGAWPGFGDVSSDGWEQIVLLTEADPLANLIGGSIPLPAGDRWTVQAVTAQRGTGGSESTVMNVAFRGPDEVNKFTFLQTSPPEDGAWFEDLQAAALNAGVIEAFRLSVDVADLRTGGRRITELEEVGPGLHERVYTSDVTLPPGEGMDYAGIDGRGTGGPSGAFGQVFHYYGRYQPYGLYLPDGPAPQELGMIYHGSNQNHSQLVNLPGLQQQIGEDDNRILASPLARGVHGYGSDISERDLEDVQADVMAHYDIDADRVMAAGYSQGGYVTFRQAALHPDRFSSFISWVGFTGDDTNPVPADLVTAGAVGNMFDFVGNYRHLPAGLIYGGADELIPVTSSAGMANEFAGRDLAHTFWLHPSGDHFQFALLDEWGKEAEYVSGRSVVRDPGHVTFRTAEVLGDVGVGTRHDEAYWVSQIRGRMTTDDPFAAEDAYIDIDLRSDGCGGEDPVLEATQGAGEAPIPWVSSGLAVTGSTPFDATPMLTGAVANLDQLAIDVAAACLTGAVEYSLTSDGPATIRLSDGRQIPLAAGDNSGRVEPPADVQMPSNRVSGADRIDTAIAVSQRAHPTAEVVVLARADQYADALSAGPLAARRDAPLLLTGRDGLDDRVRVEIARLGASAVVLAGGPAALSGNVASALTSAGLTVERLAGGDRFATAAAIAAAVVQAGGDGGTVYLVEGADADPARGWPDAVSAAALAARQGHPILLADTDVLPPSTVQALAELGTTTVQTVGGQASITNRTLAMAADPDGDGAGQVALNRIAGPDRYATSGLVADRMLDDLATTAEVWAVTGHDWPDALAAGPAAAASGGVLLLVDGNAVGGGEHARRWISANRPVDQIVLVGGPGVLAPMVISQR